MDYSQFLHMREELSLVVVLLLLFLADLFMSPDAHKNDGKARLNTMLPVILMAVHTAINLIPGTAADVFGGMYHYVPMHTVVKSILNIGTLIVFLMAHEWMKREDTAFKQGEFYVLTLSTLFGMYLMISAGHFLMFFIGLETASIPMADCFRQIPPQFFRSRCQVYPYGTFLQCVAVVRPVNDLRFCRNIVLR